MTDDERVTLVAQVLRELLVRRIVPPGKAQGACSVLGIRFDDVKAAEHLDYIQPRRVHGHRNTGKKADHTRITTTGYVPPLEGERDGKECSECGQWFELAEFKRYNKGKRADGSIRYGRDSMHRDCRLEYQRKRYVSIRQRDNLAAIGIELRDGGGLECIVCGDLIEEGEHAVGVGVVAHTGCATGGVLAEVVTIELEEKDL